MIEKLHFYMSEEIYPIAKKFFEIEKSRIKKVCHHVIVEHVGSSSIPHAITLGDLDIQIRVTKEYFESVSDTLKNLYHINHPELWTDEFALFHWKDHVDIPMSIILTVKDSTYDDFSRMRDYFLQHPEVLEKYNALKRTYEGKTYDEYRIAKKNFFGQNGKSHFLKEF